MKHGEDAWIAYGHLANRADADRLLLASLELLEAGHPEGAVMHAVALLLLERYEAAQDFVSLLNADVEGAWPKIVRAISSAALGRPIDVDDELRALLVAFEGGHVQ